MNRDEVSDIYIPHKTTQTIIIEDDNSEDSLDCGIRDIKRGVIKELYTVWFLIYFLSFMIIIAFFVGVSVGIDHVRHQAVNANVARFIPQADGREKFQFLP